MIFSAVISESEEGGYIAFNPETGTTTQGETFDQAMTNLREATELYLEVFPKAQAKTRIGGLKGQKFKMNTNFDDPKLNSEIAKTFK